jgi:TonB family protein
MRSLLLTLLIVVLPFVVLSQTPGGAALSEKTAWIRLEGPGNEVAVDIPSNNYLVAKKEDLTRVFYSDQNVFVSVEYTQRSAKRSDLLQTANMEFRRHDKDAIQKTKMFDLGDYIVAEYSETDEPTGIKTTELTVASVHGKYFIAINSTKSPNPLRDHILSSIYLGDKPLYAGMGDRATGLEAVAISSLKTSDAVEAALHKPDSTQTKLKWREERTDATPSVRYLRPSIILQKPRASYTDKARQENKNGTVRLIVTLRADGTVDDIYCLDKWNSDLENQAFQSARRVKFLPAEINGKPVDSVRMLTYGFHIY